MERSWRGLGSKAASVVPSLGVGVLSMLFIVFFSPPHWFLLGLFSIGSLLFSGFVQYRKKEVPSLGDLLRQSFGIIVYLLLIIYVSEFFGGWGLLGVVLSAIIIGLLIIYRRRKLFMEIIREIETLVFGKPLDKKVVKKHG